MTEEGANLGDLEVHGDRVGIEEVAILPLTDRTLVGQTGEETRLAIVGDQIEVIRFGKHLLQRVQVHVEEFNVVLVAIVATIVGHHYQQPIVKVLGVDDIDGRGGDRVYG